MNDDMNRSKRVLREPCRRRFLKRTLTAGAALALPGSIAGCDSWLEEDPRGLLAPSKFFNDPEEAEQAVIGIYSNLYDRQNAGRDFGIFGGWGVDLFHPATRIVSRFNYLLTYSMNAANVGNLVDNWRLYYRAIGDANLAINRIAKMENIDPELQRQLVGEAKFMRAFYYYYLTNLWGAVPMWLDELKIEEVRDLPRTPVDEVRAQMIKDLKEAEKVLPSTYGPSGAGRATKWAAKTLMVKTYLQMHDWQNARDKAKEIIDTSPHRLLDSHCAVFDENNEFNDEIIFSVNFLTTQQAPRSRTTSRANRFTPRQQDEPEIPGVEMGGFGFYTLFPSFADSFAESDLRKKCSVATEIEGVKLNWIYMPKWWDITSPQPYRGRNFILFRLADVYLMLAEAENEVSGPTPLAYEGINAVRTRAGLDPLAGLTQGQFLKAVQQERAWELGSEGHRRWDLIRWGKLVEAVQSTANFALNPKAAANIQPHHVLFPIPVQVLAKNPNLEQNPGY